MTSVTTDDLKALVIQGNCEAVCETLAPLTEDERKLLADDAARLNSWLVQYGGLEIDIGRIPADIPEYDEVVEFMTAIGEASYEDWRCPSWAAQLMEVALCEPRNIDHKASYRGWLSSDLRDKPRMLLQILAARRPPWLAKWLEKEWGEESPVPNWWVERGLIRCGALPPNDSPEYYARMAAVFPFISYHSHADAESFRELFDGTECASFRSIKEMLAADPEIFEHDIWRLFDVDSAAFRYRLTEWGTALLEFSQEGKLDRRRLLQRSLEGMALPLSPTTLSGLGKFHEMLEPTLDERESLVELYLRLLSSSNSTVVGDALSALEKLQKAKRLNADSYLQVMPSVFLVDKKSQPITAIKLAVKLMKQSPACNPQAVTAIIPAIRHRNADVQSEALSVLESCSKLLDQACMDELTNISESVAVAVRPKLAKLLQTCATNNGTNTTTRTISSESSTKSKQKQKTKTSAATEQASVPPGIHPNPLENKIRKKAEALPDLLRRQSRLDEAVRALDSNSTPTVLPLATHVVPRRNPSCVVKPVESLDELIELVSSVIERIDDIMDLERLLDGICRFHSERPVDFDQRVGALRQRLANRADNENQTVLYYSINIGFPQLLLAWLNLPPLVQTHPIHWYNMRGWFLRERISFIRDSVIGSQRFNHPMPMLAMPTHQGGWIDPVALVERLNDFYAKHHELPGYYDLAQAILRLTPDGRGEALAMLGEPDHYNGGPVLRYALGDDCEPQTFGGWGSEALLVAAERARAITLADKDYMPSLPIARASLNDREVVSVTGAIYEDPTVPFTLTEVAFSIEPTPTDVFDPNLLNHLWVRTWEAMSNPSDTSASCLAGHMAHLFDREATWSSEACRLFLLASSKDRNETRIAATDALIEAIDQLLVIPDRLGQAMFGCQSHLKLNRTLKAFNEAAQVSPLHHWVVFQSLQRYLEVTKELPSDVHLILAQMLESAMLIGAEVNPNIRGRLVPLGNKSKAGKLASQLSEIRQSSNFQLSINELILKKTFERAQRWNEIARN